MILLLIETMREIGANENGEKIESINPITNK